MMRAQDTVSLNNIEIKAKKTSLSQIGKKTQTIDSALKQQFRNNSIADVLSYSSPVFIKSYGPGGIATTAFRGGNASQTAVLWNGFNLQNAMLGQSDLSLMPAVLFDDIEIEYGGSSSLWGSGAVGGSIHLSENNKFNQGDKAVIGIGGGSFNSFNEYVNFGYSRKRFISSTKLYANVSGNNFKYRDTLDKEQPLKKQQNAGSRLAVLMQELKFILNSKQLLSVNAWLSSNQRHLPGFNTEVETKTYQFDNSLKLTANWSYNISNFKSAIRAAYFYDKINYNDSLISLFSNSGVRTVMAENENYFDWKKHQQLNWGINFSSSSAIASNYDGRRSMSRVSFLAGNKSKFFNNRLTTYISARAEYFSVGTLPVTGNISTEYNLLKNLVAKINAAKVYRQPTLNDLYWLPGGNINLKPEQGYTFEGELNFSKRVNNISVFISGAAFSRIINNWILWVPGSNGNPSPLNIQQVWSRGTETNLKASYSKNKISTGFSGTTAYVIATIESSKQENGSNLNRQLIYTPRYTANGHVFVTYKNLSLFYLHQYVGYRFVTSDNLNWLVPYHISSVKFNYTINFKAASLGVFVACNNLMNKNYTVIAARPMPLRYCEFGLNYNINFKKT